MFSGSIGLAGAEGNGTTSTKESTGGWTHKPSRMQETWVYMLSILGIVGQSPDHRREAPLTRIMTDPFPLGDHRSKEKTYSGMRI